MVCRCVHASRSKSLQNRNKGQDSSFIPFLSRATDTHNTSMVQTSSIPTTHLESLCIPFRISIKNQDTCIRTWAGFQTISCLEKWLCQADPDLGGSRGDDHTALLQPSPFHFHWWGSYCGVSLWKKKTTDADRKNHASVSILETHCSRVKTAANFKSLNSKLSESNLLPISQPSIYHFSSALKLCIQNEKHSETEHKIQSALCFLCLSPPLRSHILQHICEH